ncbi:hypothetical protein CTRI78_v005868 [Colletotrichum trifolii]|uniref:Uncharacterized protein n=1 Tax=Colletotrichum trifolii TaxID=5466 RepID=A0A4R8RKI1_COLTR|nr:hypothetical protein CTRI78_v005868 [Colletotrichum trifolii]
MPIQLTDIWPSQTQFCSAPEGRCSKDCNILGCAFTRINPPQAQNSTWQRRTKSFSNVRRYPSLHQKRAMFPQRLSPEFKPEWIGRRH